MGSTLAAQTTRGIIGEMMRQPDQVELRPPLARRKMVKKRK